MPRRAAALFALAVATLVAACKVPATGVVVTVAGSGLQLDQLRVVATADGLALPPHLVPAAAAPLTLPVTFFAELPSGARSVGFDVTALAAGVAVAHGSSPAIALAAQKEPAVTVELGAPGDDGGVAICGATAQPTACTGYAFCDGFEDESGTTFTSWTASAVSNAGGGAANPGTALDVVGAPVCAGNHALHAITVGASQQAFVYKNGVSYPSPTHLRAFVYLPAATATSASYDLFSFATADVAHYLQLGYDPAHAKLFFFSNFGPEIDLPTTLPTGRWICLQAALRFDATAGSVDVAVDGASIGAQSSVATAPAGVSYDTFDAGIVFATSSTEVYLDEIVLSATAVGCQ